MLHHACTLSVLVTRCGGDGVPDGMASAGRRHLRPASGADGGDTTKDLEIRSPGVLCLCSLSLTPPTIRNGSNIPGAACTSHGHISKRCTTCTVHAPLAPCQLLESAVLISRELHSMQVRCHRDGHGPRCASSVRGAETALVGLLSVHSAV